MMRTLFNEVFAGRFPTASSSQETQEERRYLYALKEQLRLHLGPNRDINEM
ncbi:MAG: hypothetical protein HY094_00805 [Candidatus Melainabacteria bacterium]|nr:hypothetical protein [Candidatus Melainabacteria bacterium]